VNTGGKILNNPPHQEPNVSENRPTDLVDYANFSVERKQNDEIFGALFGFTFVARLYQIPGRDATLAA
jgi:hypothetical protein